MFVRVKKSGNNQYLQIVENRRENGKTKQRVISTIGRLDRLQARGDIETLVRSLSRFSEKVLMVLSGKSDPHTQAVKIGPTLIFERLWDETGIKSILKRLLRQRKFQYDVERAIFLTVLHRLLVSGSDRFCDEWRRDYKINGTEELSLHHLYRAMAFLGEELKDQNDALVFSPRRIKDIIEEDLFMERRHLFSDLELVFFDTTSIYFEGSGGEVIGRYGHSKDHRPDLKQMVVGVVLDNKGIPLCCEMWPGNTTDVKTLVPVVKRMKKRFGIGRIIIVADRGMISKEVLSWLEKQDNMQYILGVRMRKVVEVKRDVLSRGGSYHEVYPEKHRSKDPTPLKVKEVRMDDRRYIVCLNPTQARKDKTDRQAILESLEQALQQGAKSLVGNKGYRKYLKIDKDSVSINLDKVNYEERFDGKWVLRTNTTLSAKDVALKYKELWQVEHIFRDMKSLLDTRPVFHQRDDTITGHVFCSFLALVLLKELKRRLSDAGYDFEWRKITQDLKALHEIVVEEKEKQLVVRTECQGVSGKVFQAVGVALPPTIRAL